MPEFRKEASRPFTNHPGAARHPSFEGGEWARLEPTLIPLLSKEGVARSAGVVSNFNLLRNVECSRPYMDVEKYVANLSLGTRVRLIGLGLHPRHGDECTIIAILPNPSQASEHQWYDVRFEDGIYGRFLEKYLVETQEIPAKDWPEFFEGFSRRHATWIVYIEIFDRETSEQIRSRTLHLKSITAEDGMIVIVGEDEVNEISQLVRGSSRVLLTKSSGGADEGIEIDSEK